jgi:hypothetical protein
LAPIIAGSADGPPKWAMSPLQKLAASDKTTAFVDGREAASKIFF